MARFNSEDYSTHALMAELNQYLTMIEESPYDFSKSDLDLVKKVRMQIQTMSFAKLCGMLGFFQCYFQAHPDFEGKQIFHREWDN